MSSIMNYFDDWKNQDVKIYNKNNTFNDGEASSSPLLVTTIPAVFYEGRAAEAIISERFRADILGILVIQPDELVDSGGSPVIISDGDRIDVGTVSYSSIHLDNVMGLEEAYIVGLKEFT